MGKLSLPLVGIILTFFLVGCFEIVEPTPPSSVGGSCDDNSDASDSVDVENCSGISGRVYRFTELKVDEPADLKQSLDKMWEHEISDYLLNVLVRVKDAEESSDEDEAFSNLSVTVGSAWRSPVTGYFWDEIVELNADGIETYCFLDDDLNIDVDLAPTGKDARTFSNDEPQILYFHIGSMADPLACAPLLEPADSTPLHQLKVTFGLDDDCDNIVNGYLEGCLPQYAVSKMCMCSYTGTCGRENPDEDVEFPQADSDGNYVTSELTKYCQKRCGQGTDELFGAWTSFRTIMEAFEQPPNCETAEGDPGYTLSANFVAENVTSLFSADKSECENDK